LSCNKDSVFPILSLFSGGGFLDIGFINQGFQINEAVEIEPHFIEAYNYGLNHYFSNTKNYYIRNNYVSHKVIQRPVDASCKKEQRRLKNEHIGVSGIIGGPPCQDYSAGGKNGGIEGERGRLINSYLKIVKLTKPQFLFFENVEGLYKTRKHRKSFDAFVLDLEKCGYTVWHDLINVLDYGYPQDRQRIALVAFKNKIVKSLIRSGYRLEKNNTILKSTETDNFVFKWPKRKYENPKKLAWPSKWDFGDTSKGYILNGHSELSVEHAFKGLGESVPNQQEHFLPKSRKFNEVQEGDTNRKSFKRLHRFKYSPTVAYGNNEVHLHPTEPRRLTVREGLRLQTVPDEYVLPSQMPLTPKFKIISNGVPTAIAELIAMEIRKTLTNYEKLKMK
jgi:DNA (cytosine-5)-methyltransferase 1